MMPSRNYNLQLEQMLVQIARDYSLPIIPAGWQKPGDLAIPLHRFVEAMLPYKVLALVAEKHNLAPDAPEAAVRECARRFGQLYDYLVLNLYSTQSGERLQAALYPNDDFLVLALKAPLAPVIEVFGQQLVPFIMQYHRQPRPPEPVFQQLVESMLVSLYAEPEKNLCAGLIERIEPMLIMRLRLLPLAPHRPDTLPAAPDSAASQPAEPDPASLPAPSGRRQRHRLRAPLPYWNIKNRPETEE
jgi:hypothetical protein